jgi:hypothetical protein
MNLVVKTVKGSPRLERAASNPFSTPSSPAERRREVRYPANDPVEICILDAAGTPRFAGTVVDVSRSGLRVEVPTPVGKGARIEIVLPDRAIVFGEIRYCRRAADCFHLGVAIEDVYYAQPLSAKHIPDDQLSFYLAGKGITTADAIRIKSHLAGCQACRDRLAEAEAMLRLMKKRP